MDRLDQIRQELRAFVAERDWAQFHDPKNLAMAVVSEAGELAAEYRWIANAEADAWSRDPEPGGAGDGGRRNSPAPVL